MPDARDTNLMSVKEVAEATGIPASTIRYYDQQFEEFLGIKRGAGRRRMFETQAVDRLLEVRRLLKDEGLNLRQARQRLTESGDSPSPAVAAPPQVTVEDMASLKQRVKVLEEQMAELRDIQRRTLALVDSLSSK